MIHRSMETGIWKVYYACGKKYFELFEKTIAFGAGIFFCGMSVCPFAAAGRIVRTCFRRYVGGAVGVHRIAAAETGRQDRLWRDILFFSSLDGLDIQRLYRADCHTLDHHQDFTQYMGICRLATLSSVPRMYHNG
mgnify:CR=1 FL=1